MKSRPDQYGSVAVTMHWLSAIAILVLLGSGFGAAMTIDPAIKIMLLQLHVPLAIIVLALTLARIAWWLLADRKPAPIAGTPAWQEALARFTHRLLYLVLVIMLASGIGLLAMSGAGSILLSGAGTLPDFTQFPPRMAHGLGAFALIALLAAHVGAALYHHLVRRDAIFRRMWYGRQ
ncbi:cytochrome b [Devosia honganensis]|uniref:Cytochrome b n=1 Tax=Devosia honganensis TaxID=1610527 RepID=A0ABV7WWH8_9HYPH